MPFGGDTITFVNRAESGTPDELGNMTLTVAATDAPGCRHRPLTFRETAEAEFDVATELWKSTIPIGEYDTGLRSTILGVKANDVIQVDGVDYQIIGGIRPHDDMDGSPFKATIISQKQIG